MRPELVGDRTLSAVIVKAVGKGGHNEAMDDAIRTTPVLMLDDGSGIPFAVPFRIAGEPFRTRTRICDLGTETSVPKDVVEVDIINLT
jgi:hypothetical protein